MTYVVTGWVWAGLDGAERVRMEPIQRKVRQVDGRRGAGMNDPERRKGQTRPEGTHADAQRERETCRTEIKPQVEAKVQGSSFPTWMSMLDRLLGVWNDGERQGK